MSTLNSLALYDPPAPFLVNDAIPTPLNDLIVQLLEKDKNKRLAKAEAVVERLRALEIGAGVITADHNAAPTMTAVPALDSPSAPTPQKGRTGKHAPRLSRSPVPIIIAAVALVAVVTFAAVAGVLVFWLM